MKDPEAEHIILVIGLFVIILSFAYNPAFKFGVIICILSYAVDLVRRKDIYINDEDLPELLKEQAE